MGSVQFGTAYGVSNKFGQVHTTEVKNILAYAQANGIRTIDTAAGYGNAEQVLGACLNSNWDCSVITKVRPIKNAVIDVNVIETVAKDFNCSQGYFSRSGIDGLLIHQVDDLFKPGAQTLFEYLLDLKRQGAVTKIGASVYSGEQIKRLIDLYEVDLVQLPLNILDQRLLVDGSIERLRSRGIQVHTRSAFLQGLLLMTPDTVPKHLRQLMPLLEKFWGVCARLSITPMQGALGFFHAIEGVSNLIVGVTSKEQLSEIVEAFEFIAKLDVEEFREASNEVLLDPRNWS